MKYILLMFTLSVSACVQSGPMIVRTPHTQQYPANLNELVWNRTIEYLAVHNYHITLMEKASGQVNTDWGPVVVPMKMGSVSYRTQDRLSILVGSSGRLTVNINRRFRIYDTDGVYTTDWALVTQGLKKDVQPILDEQERIANEILKGMIDAQRRKLTGSTLTNVASCVDELSLGTSLTGGRCCKRCGAKSKACGDSCISLKKTCHKPNGCACN